MSTPYRHPAELERVTVDSVCAVLDTELSARGRVFLWRAGVVRVEVGALLPRCCRVGGERANGPF
jgi:hypothetical protein